ncbi:EF-hand domain-containing protein [Pseudoalteromonas sp. MMG013]|uniref:EF-hand domain-containing protein n=1 Tax=Pseudoalteromonas aurantia 208 TaxID=1314867 RepID=A0ABR9EIE1_9GAMM|nr:MULTISPECIES: EF-hand domain-containing protein [Pseudoalteromonas]MBE0370754.1 hypothetical protein [Pseudoalteromonas aurantia 208]MBQ4850214.1 EF-hand domain-containing protein [Pseudoalteromonas sp. MMG012]MBQ4860691.1 EF-hand domain-containing protein [Pseudoalteromonas sp. MMG013]
MKIFTALFTAILLGVSHGAIASNFSSLDSDKDGFISKSEAAHSESLLKVFDLLDSDKDGKLSKKEFHQ